MNSAGFFSLARPADATYTDTLVLTVAVPRGSKPLLDRIAHGLRFVMGSCRITACGPEQTPHDALRTHQNINARKERP